MNINLILFCIADAIDDLWTEMGYEDYMECQAAGDEFIPQRWDSTSKIMWLRKIDSFDAYYVFWLDKEEPSRPFFEVRHVATK